MRIKSPTTPISSNQREVIDEFAYELRQYKTFQEIPYGKIENLLESAWDGNKRALNFLYTNKANLKEDIVFMRLRHFLRCSWCFSMGPQ